MNDADSRSLVLVVDDAPVARHLITRLLEAAGYTVIAEASAEQAQISFESHGAAAFDCLVTDYLMPGMNGVDLRAWVQVQDPAITAILVTAGGEQKLVEQSLRAGFVDFLNKPVAPAELRVAVQKAVAATRARREIDHMARSVEQAGRAQKRLLSAELRGGLLQAEVYARPIASAGGDFFSHILISPTEEVVLLADVSGHDLSAAYTSAYFQGMVRGMLESGRDLGFTMQCFNRILAEDGESVTDAESVSISACGLSYDAESSEVRVINCGPPLALFTSATGWSEPASLTPSYPLGWFADNPIRATRHDFSGGEFILWTDGLGDLADVLSANPLSVAHALLTARANGNEPDWLSLATDDIMVARVQLRSQPEVFHTLINESYGVEHEDKIDALQQHWRDSISLAIFESEIQDNCEFMYDAMLCAREALLNAIRYGCAPGQTARFQVSCRMDLAMLRIRVSDPGPGHDFDSTVHEEPGQELLEAHRGLMLIRALSGQLAIARNGSELTMDFFWKGSSHEPSSVPC